MVLVQGGTATQVIIDGKEFSSVVVGIPMPINPGQHTFKALGDASESSEVTLNFAEAARLDVNLQMQATGAPAAPDATPADSGQSSQVSADSNDFMADQGGSSKQGMRIGSYVAFGVGAVGLAAGTVFLLQRSSKQGDADDAYARFEDQNCLTQTSSSCRTLAQEIQGLDDDAASAGTLATVGFVVGAAAAGAGVALFILSQDDTGSARPAEPAVVPYASWNSIGVTGTF